MSAEIDIAGHTISAGGGGVIALLVDRVIRFFAERDRREAEIAMASKLATIEQKLDDTLKRLDEHANLAERLAKLEGIEQGRREARS